MDRLDVRGIAVDVEDKGTGKPLLYLHGEQFVASADSFLDTLATSCRVIAPRHPGYGDAPFPDDVRAVGDLAYLYLDLIEQLDLQEVTLVGASLGGWIALEMAVRNTSRLARLVLIGAVGVKFSGREERDFADVFYLPDADASAMLFADPARWAPHYADLPADAVEALARERQTLAYYAWKPYLHNPGLRRWLHRVDVPTRVIWGEQDRFATPDYANRLVDSLPNAELTLIPDAGHYPQIEQADTVAQTIATFARR